MDNARSSLFSELLALYNLCLSIYFVLSISIFPHLNVSGFWKPSVKSNIFESFHQHSIGNRNIKVLSGLHLEFVHCVSCLRNIDLITVLHFRFSPFVVFSERSAPFRWKTTFLSAVIAFPKCFGLSLHSFGNCHSFWKRIRKTHGNFRILVNKSHCGDRCR